MTTDEEIKNGMTRSLWKWGVRPNNDPEHKRFFERAITAALLDSRAKSNDTDRGADGPLSEPFPRDVKEAIEFVLRSEVLGRRKAGEGETAPRSITLDLILCGPKGEWPAATKQSNIRGNAPYFFHEKENRFQIGKGFGKYGDRKELDPLLRFVAGDVSEKVNFYSAWFENKVVMGLAFEAIVASHAIHNGSCVRCAREGSLIWSGGQGTNSSWRDIECTNCLSTYEVKSKQSTEHIKKDLGFNSIRGGSYYRFHKLRAALSKKRKMGVRTAKQYLVMISRSPSWRTGRGVWEVDYVEISHVVPCLKDTSFSLRNRGDYLPIGSEIVTNVESRRKWFDVPYVEFDSDEIAKIVYDEFFPPGTREGLRDKWASGAIFEEIYAAFLAKDVSEQEENEAGTSVKPETPDAVTIMKEELEKLSMGEGVWDDLSSDED